MKGKHMGIVVATKDVSSIKLHPKTLKEIEELGAEVILARRTAMARVAHRNDSPLASGYRKEAELIATKFNLPLT